MADLALRFHKDMLVLSSPITASLARQGINVERDLELVNLLEAETVKDLQQLELSAGAACLVTNTQGITPARLAHQKMENRLADLAASALAIAHELKPQHILVSIEPCGLPLDRSSKASLNEHIDQYARAARGFEGQAFDAYLLSGFEDSYSLQCALMGLKKASDHLIVASVNVAPDKLLADGREDIAKAVCVMAEYGAAVAGFATAAGAQEASEIAREVVRTSGLPTLAQLYVKEADPPGTSSWRRTEPTDANPYPNPEALLHTVQLLQESGVQFLQAIGDTHVGYTALLAAATGGSDVVLP